MLDQPPLLIPLRISATLGGLNHPDTLLRKMYLAVQKNEKEFPDDFFFLDFLGEKKPVALQQNSLRTWRCSVPSSPAQLPVATPSIPFQGRCFPAKKRTQLPGTRWRAVQADEWVLSLGVRISCVEFVVQLFFFFFFISLKRKFLFLRHFLIFLKEEAFFTGSCFNVLLRKYFFSFFF